VATSRLLSSLRRFQQAAFGSALMHHSIAQNEVREARSQDPNSEGHIVRCRKQES
jgi:hypothetical protein